MTSIGEGLLDQNVDITYLRHGSTWDPTPHESLVLLAK